MRIVFTTLCRATMGSGMGRVAYEFAPAVARQHPVLLICPGRSTRIVRQTPNLTILEVRNASEGEQAIPYFGLRRIKAMFNHLEAFGPDVIHAQDLGPVSLLVQLWAIENGIPFVYTSHFSPTRSVEVNPIESPKWLGEFSENTLLKAYYRDFLRNCDAVIALNDRSRADVLAFGYEGRTFTIPNGRNLELYNTRTFADIDQAEKRLLYVGFLTRSKNQRYLLEVMRHLPGNYMLDLVGHPREPRYSQSLREYARIHNLRVNFVGKVDHNEIPERLERAHVFVSASRLEVQSLAVLEALSSGTPVVSLSNETTDEFVDDSVGYNLPLSTPPERFAAKIVEICGLPRGEYERLCENARKRVAHLDWAMVVESATRMYSEVIDLKRRAVGCAGADHGPTETLRAPWADRLRRRVPGLGGQPAVGRPTSAYQSARHGLYVLLMVVGSFLGDCWFACSRRWKTRRGKRVMESGRI